MFQNHGGRQQGRKGAGKSESEWKTRAIKKKKDEKSLKKKENRGKK